MNRRQWVIEVAITSMVLGGLCWSIPPDVNESHYLTKAKHLWNDAWCGNDLFLNSFDTHWLSFATLGLPCVVFDLSTAAWIGRVLCWVVLAASFVRLSRVWTGRTWIGCSIGPATVLVNRYGHWSGEWFCGGAEGKTISYAFVIFSLAYALEGRWRRTWIMLGIASAFHILVGGWCMIAFFTAAVIVRLVSRNVPPRNVPPLVQGGARGGDADHENHSNSSPQPIKPQFFPGILIGFAIAIIGLIPALMQNWNVDHDIAVEAAAVQVSSRIAHHLNCNEFQTGRHIAFFVTMFVFVAISIRSRSSQRYRMVMWVAIAAIGLAAAGGLLSNRFISDPENDLVVRLLTLYWFRIADVLVPLAIVLGITFKPDKEGQSPAPVWVFEIMAAVIVLGLLAHTAIRVSDSRPPATVQSQFGYFENRRHAIEAHKNWKKVCEWIRANTPADAQFLTPRSQQTFKWYAGRGEVANWKDMPQDAESVVEWIDRFDEIYLRVPEEPYGLLSFLDSELIAFSQKYDIDYLSSGSDTKTSETNWAIPFPWRESIPEDPNEKSTFVVFKFPVDE